MDCFADKAQGTRVIICLKLVEDNEHWTMQQQTAYTEEGSDCIYRIKSF